MRIPGKAKVDQSIPSTAGAVVSPVPASERLPVLDALRGLAALGILWRNIFVFGLPTVAFSLPEQWGLAIDWNVTTWLFVVIFVDGTMRGLFSMLFGATAILIMDRYERRPGGLFAADLYFRRLMWLVAFGLVHGYLLLWPYDVLYVYGLLGMFLFVFRNLRGRSLLMIALALFVVSSLKDGTGWSLDQASVEAYDSQLSAAADTPQDTGSEIGADAGAQDLPDIVAAPRPDTATGEAAGADAAQVDEAEQAEEEEAAQQIQELERLALAEMDERLASYPDLLRTIALETFQEQTTLFFSDHVLDVGSMMFFGMALFRLGGLSGRWRTRTYLAMAVAGLGGGVLLGFLIHGTTTLAAWEAYSIGDWDAYFYNARRLLLCLGLIGLFNLVLRAKAGATLLLPFVAVGRIPLTIYVGQTVICIFLFYGIGFGLFGTMEHHELLGVAFLINLAQIVFALLWLRSGRQGPLEALLRLLIAGGRQH
jgi:uncharacterized protein